MDDRQRTSTEPRAQHQIQSLDVSIVDVLAHLEALLRASHSIQRALLTLRTEAPPPSLALPQATIAALRTNAAQMRRDRQTLGGIVEDLMSGIEALSAPKS
jgi:hypothetical protein